MIPNRRKFTCRKKRSKRMQRNFSEIQKCKGGDNPNILKNQDMEIDMSNVEFNFN